MPQFGTIKRQTPRIEVHRGFNPNEPHTLSAAHPVASGVTIVSGQVISKQWNGTTSQYEWVLGVAGANIVPHFALNDSADEDVIEAGVLPALSAQGQFELSTPFYKDGDTYNDGVALTFDGVTGDVKATTAGSGEPILGICSKMHGLIDITGTNSNCVQKTVVRLATGYQVNADTTP